MARAAQCFAQHPERREHEHFHCNLCIFVRRAVRLGMFVGFVAVLYLYWGSAAQ